MNTRTNQLTGLLAALTIPGPLCFGAIVFSSRAASPPGIHIISEQDETSSFAEILTVPPGREIDCRVGDAITLAGTDRFVTEFTTRLWSFTQPASPITTDVQLTIYQNVANMPGTEIWSGTIASIALNGTTPVDVTFNPNVTVPNSICFAIAFTNTTATRLFGVVSSGTVFVGSSPVFNLRQDTATLAWRQDPGLGPGPNAFSHVDARITAIPAPATIALFTPALLLTRRRERRAS